MSHNLRIYAKCSDMFSATLEKGTGEVSAEYDGYVPDFMPGNTGGAYVALVIELETGKIVNWPKLSAGDARVLDYFKNPDENEDYDE